MIKFSLKLGIAAGAVYYTTEQGLWGSNDDSSKLSAKIRQNVNPYIKNEIEPRLPFRFSTLPNTNQVSYLAKGYWNDGINVTFKFLMELPERSTSLVKCGIRSVKENQEVRNFINSFSGEKPSQK